MYLHPHNKDWSKTEDMRKPFLGGKGMKPYCISDPSPIWSKSLRLWKRNRKATLPGKDPLLLEEGRRKATFYCEKIDHHTPPLPGKSICYWSDLMEIWIFKEMESIKTGRIGINIKTFSLFLFILKDNWLKQHHSRSYNMSRNKIYENSTKYGREEQIYTITRFLTSHAKQKILCRNALW